MEIKRSHSRVNRLVLCMIICLVYISLSYLYIYIPLSGSTLSGDIRFITSGVSHDSTEQHTEFRMYVTPEDPAVIELAAQLNSIEAAYRTANGWVYVPEQRLNNTTDLWLTPHEFLVETPKYKTNPFPGFVAGDCEEQANTLASLIRALGVSAENIRVALGKVSASDHIIKGHVWVELYRDGEWIQLDPSQGPQWNTDIDQLMVYQGLDFEYYADNPYPVPYISAYYNDIYFWDVEIGSGEAPDFWKE